MGKTERKKMKFNALATDVDGTLTTRGEGISLEAVGLIRQLESRGIPVCLASARPYPVLKTLQTFLLTTGPLICENGGVVAYEEEQIILGDRSDGLQAYRELVEEFGENVREAWTNPYNLVDIAIGRGIPWERVLGVLHGYPSLRLLDSGYFYHLMPRNVDKGKGLKVAAELTGSYTEDFVGIGDSQVDIELLDAAGFGVAVTDSEHLSPVADLVTEKRNSAGFCEAVRRVF